jgi:hypothetical protein
VRGEFVAQTDFTVGQDRFQDLTIAPSPDRTFYYFFHSPRRTLIKRFILDDRQLVRYDCRVTLIKSGEKFTPRLHFAVRDKTGRLAKKRVSANEDTLSLKASVDLGDCHARYWALISYLKSVTELDIPDESFSLVTKDVQQIVSAIRRRDAESIKSIIKLLSATENVALSETDVSELLQRRRRLRSFKEALTAKHNESWWQPFFKDNKWIFGYGLNYVILRLEESQANVGGARLDRGGAGVPDFLASTSGEVRFTVLVEIKTPETPLLSGHEEVRSGAWSLSKDLVDALTQTQANIDRWATQGAALPENRDRLEQQRIFTVKPKGIVVIGRLDEVGSSRHKLETLERFRQSLHGVEIITFDELYERARFIVERSS